MPTKLSPKAKKLRTVRRLAGRRLSKSFKRGIPGQDQTDTHLPPYTGKYSAIQTQVYMEYNLNWNYMRPKIQNWLMRLRLYNNQRRDQEKVGEPLIYETHQTVMSILYGDRLQVEFGGRVEGDRDQSDNLNIVAENDYDEMEKDKLDYEWDWDAGFFGAGFVLMNDFDTVSKTPVPTVIDPTTFIPNPGCRWINGNRAGEGALLYGGYEVRLTESMMRKNPRSKSNPYGYFNLDKLIKTNDLFSLSGEAARLRREAQGFNDIYTFENSISENYEYSILRWFTHIPDPETGISRKYIVELANNRMLPVRIIPLDRDYWPLIERKFSPIAHDLYGVSIPDLVEDKQRFKAKMLNTAGDTAMADVNGMYLFHEDRFHKTQDFNFRFGKWIPVKGPGPLGDAAQPLQTRTVTPTVQYVLQYLDQSAKQAVAAPNLQQGAPSNNPRLGQDNMQMQGVAGRHSLTAKVFGWSEKEFWRHWYFIYDEYFYDELGEKISTLQGAFGIKWRPIKRADIITGNTLGPTIKVSSKANSDQAKQNEFLRLQGYVQSLVVDPTVNVDKTYVYRKLGRLIMPKQEVERVIPLSADEYQALEENKKLNEKEMPRVTIEQNHEVHLRIHADADDNPVTRRHIQIHIYMLMQKRQNPTAFPQLPGEIAGGAKMTPGQPGQNAASAATPSPVNVAGAGSTQ